MLAGSLNSSFPNSIMIPRSAVHPGGGHGCAGRIREAEVLFKRKKDYADAFRKRQGIGEGSCLTAQIPRRRLPTDADDCAALPAGRNEGKYE